MASGQVSAAIEDFLIEYWTATPLLLENKSKTEGDAGVEMPPDKAFDFVEIGFTGKTYGQVSLGASRQADNRWDETGVLFLSVFVRRGSGSRAARTYAKNLCDLFRGLLLLGDSLEFLDASIGEGERSDKYKGNYYEIPVDVEWVRVEA